MFVETKKEGEVQIPQEPWRVMLFNAASYLEGLDLCKGTLVRDEGRSVCTLGAIHFSSDLLANVHEPIEHLMRYLKLEHVPGQTEHPVAIWNDVPDRTKDEVVAALRGAAFT